MNRAERRKHGIQGKSNDIAQVVKQDRQQLITAGLISSLEILKRDFGFTDEQMRQFSDKYIPEMQKQMNINAK